MHSSPLSIDELSRRFNGQQRLEVDMVPAGAPQRPNLEDYDMLPNNSNGENGGENELPPETAARPVRAARLVALAAVEDDPVHSITPIARIFHAGKRRQRRVVSPSPFVLQQLPSSAGVVSGQVEKALKISSVPLGPSKRKLHMSPYAALDDVGGSGGNIAARRRVTRRKVSISGRRLSSSATPRIPRTRSFLAPPSSTDPPALPAGGSTVHTAIATSSP